MKTVGIIYNSRIPEALDLSAAIFNSLEVSKESWVSSAENPEPLLQRMPGTEVVITAGGDGTILRSVQATAPHAVPIVGVNMGHLGFMTELQVGEALNKLPRYLNGDCRVEERTMLQARLCRSGKGNSAPQIDGPYYALNDTVLARGAVSRLVTIDATVDGVHLAVFRSDGVIISTATGSSGYNLSVGGPILDPLSENLVLTPVAVHIGLSTPLVLLPSAKVRLALEGHHQAILSVDGYVDHPMTPGDYVAVEQSPLKARFLRADPPNQFYANLTRRLGFSMSQR